MTRSEKDHERYMQSRAERQAKQREYYAEHRDEILLKKRAKSMEESNKQIQIEKREREIALQNNSKYEELYQAVLDMRHQQKRYKRFGKEETRERMEVAEKVVDSILDKLKDTQVKLF